MSCSSLSGCNDDAHRTYYPECYSSSTTNTSNVVDWAPYIQCALNDAAASGGTVLLGAMGVSRYTYASRLEVGDGTHAVTLKGQSSSVVLSAQNPFGSGAVNSLIVNPGSVIDTLSIQGNGAYDGGGGRLTGVAFGGGSGTGNAQVKNASIQSFTEYGINYAGGRVNCTVSGCVISNNSRSGILSGGTGDTTDNTGNFVLNNTIYDNGEDGVDNGNGSNTTISGNSCYGNGWWNSTGDDSHGVLLYAEDGQSNRNHVQSNTCYSNYGSGIKVSHGASSTVDHNTVSQNTCYSNGADGVTVTADCANTVVDNNYLHNNPSYGLYGPGDPLRNSASNNTWCDNGVSDVSAPNWTLFNNHTC